MQDAAAPSPFEGFSDSLASDADFADYCTLALPDVCAQYYKDELGGAQEIDIQMTFGNQYKVGCLCVTCMKEEVHGQDERVHVANR